MSLLISENVIIDRDGVTIQLNLAICLCTKNQENLLLLRRLLHGGVPREEEHLPAIILSMHGGGISEKVYHGDKESD